MKTVAMINEQNAKTLSKISALQLKDVEEVSRLRKKFPFFGYIDVKLPNGQTVCMLSNNDEIVSLTNLWVDGFVFEKKSISIWMQYAERSNVILDVGSHVGIYALAAASVNEMAKIVAFEAVDFVYARLFQNISANAFSNIEARHLAVSDSEGVTKINVKFGPATLSSGSSLEMRKSFSKDIQSKIVAKDTIQNELDNASVDLVKIDVEGHEMPVLNGMRDIIERRRPIILCEVLYVEFNDGEVWNFLRNFGYTIYQVDDRTNSVHLTTQGNSFRRGAPNSFCIPNERLDEFERFVNQG